MTLLPKEIGRFHLYSEYVSNTRDKYLYNGEDGLPRFFDICVYIISQIDAIFHPSKYGCGIKITLHEAINSYTNYYYIYIYTFTGDEETDIGEINKIIAEFENKANSVLNAENECEIINKKCKDKYYRVLDKL